MDGISLNWTKFVLIFLFVKILFHNDDSSGQILTTHNDYRREIFSVKTNATISTTFTEMVKNCLMHFCQLGLGVYSKLKFVSLNQLIVAIFIISKGIVNNEWNKAWQNVKV